MNFRAFSVILLKSLAATAALSTSSEPTAKAAEPAAMNSAAVFRFTPPVGIRSIGGNGTFKALMYFDPPTLSQGNTFTKSDPASHAVTTSVGVSAPGMIGLLYRLHISMVEDFNDGVTINSAPASMQARAVSGSRTVPAPTSTCFP